MQLTVSPGIYCRQAGAIAKTGYYAALTGATACVIGGKRALNCVGAAIRDSLEANNVKLIDEIWYGGECTWDNVNRLAALPSVREAEVLIGVGGGRALDTSKLVAYKVQKPLITVPTIAATCAAWSTIGVVNDANGAFLEVSNLAANPQTVIVDSQIIAAAPSEFLVAGMGDTLAKWYEGEASTRGKQVNQNGRAALALARLIRDTIIEQGERALADARQGQASSALEEVVDGIIMLAGMVSNLGGDACRTSGAHSFYSALTILEPIHAVLHGKVVGFGILCQLIMDKASEHSIDEYVAFCRKVGLPVTLAEMGIGDLTDRQLQQVAVRATEIPDMANMPYRVTAAMVAAAIRGADARGRQGRMQG